MSQGNSRLTQSLQLLNEEKYYKIASDLARVTLSFLLNTSSFDYQGQLSEVARTCDFPAGTFKVVAQGVLVLLYDVLNNGASTEYLRKKAISYGMNAEITQIFCGMWSSYTSKIANHLCSKIITKNRLIDLDWSFGVTAASDDSNNVGKTYLQVKLTIDEDGSGPKNVFLELSLEQFYQFLASLEKCRTFLDFVSPR